MSARNPPSARTPAHRPGTTTLRSALVLIAVAVLAGTAGCRSGTALPLPNPSAVAEGDPNWFCGTGTENGEWACVRDQELRVGAAPPEPPARPQTAPVATEPPVPEPMPDARTDVADDSVLGVEPLPPTDAPTITKAAPKESPPDAPRDQPGERPGGTVPLVDVPPDYYVVQLVALASKEALEEYAARKGLHGMSAARVERDGKLFYVLLLGIFRDRQDADAAAANLPPELEDFDPWVRRVGSLQEAIRRGDALAGTSEI